MTRYIFGNGRTNQAGLMYSNWGYVVYPEMEIGII